MKGLQPWSSVSQRVKINGGGPQSVYQHVLTVKNSEYATFWIAGQFILPDGHRFCSAPPCWPPQVQFGTNKDDRQNVTDTSLYTVKTVCVLYAACCQWVQICSFIYLFWWWVTG